MQWLRGGDEHSSLLSSSCLPLFREADRHSIGGPLVVVQYFLWACIEPSRSSRRVSRQSPIRNRFEPSCNNKQNTYIETHNVLHITYIRKQGIGDVT